MKKSKRVVSLLLSVLMLLSVLQTGFVAFAVDESGTVPNSTEANILPDAGAVTTSTQVVRVASGFYSYQPGTTIVPATPSGIPMMDGQDYDDNSLANVGNIKEEASYPFVKITFADLPSDVPQITCINSKSASNVVMSTATYNASEKSYSWIIASGTANVGDTLKFKITYTYNGKQYVSNAYSYVESIAQPAGSYVTTESTYASGWFGWGTKYRAGVTAATRVLGINTYGSLESFTTSSSDSRGYFNAATNEYVLRSGNDYVTYGVSRSQSTQDENSVLVYELNDRRSYADVYVDTSVHDSFADLNLRFAVTKENTVVGENSTQALTAVVVTKEKANASSNLEGTGEQELGKIPATGETMSVGTQYVTTFSGSTFIDNAEYTIITAIEASHQGAKNATYFPVGLRIHTADKGALRSLINDILHNNIPESPLTTAANKGVNPQSWYYASGFSAYETAMLGAQTALQNPRATQTEINNAATTLTNAYNNLVLAGADYSGVNEAIEAAAAYEETKDDYTPESYANLQTVIGEVQSGFSVLYQPQVDAMAKAIRDAINGLEYILADYTALNEAYAKASEAEATPDLYYDFSGVKAAMDNIDWNVRKNEQARVDAMTAALNTALINLKYKPANYTAVNAAVEVAQTYIASNYTEDSYTALRNLLRSIDYTLDASQQSTVDNYVTQINEAIANLDELPADYTELEALLTQVENLVPEYYYPDTYQNVLDVAATCEGYNEIGITRQDEINAMRDNLQSAIDALDMYDADYSKIEDLIAEYNAMDLTQITESSITGVEDAISAVKYGLKKDKQKDVDNYALAIESAIKSLAYQPANYSAVTLAIERAEAVNRSYWSANSLALLDAALEAVEYGYGVNRQSEVDDMANNINTAINNLQPGPADYTRVNEAIAKFDALDPSHYTVASLAVVRNIINGIDYSLTKDQQDIVNGYAFDITNKMLELVPAKANYDELNEILNSIPVDLASQYTQASIDKLNSVKNSINWDLYAKDQSIVVGYQNSLRDAIAGLTYLTGDYTDVDAAIAEGRAIIEKNDPPISAESIAMFEDLVASINRNYTIKQEAEIAALAVQIRAAYAQFSYSEAIHKASISLVGDRTSTFPGDIVTVSVVVGTDYYAASTSIPVLYDTNFYELVGTSVSSAYVFEGSFAAACQNGGNINSPVKGYPSSYTAEDIEQWRYALITLTPSSKLNNQAQILDPEQTVVKLQFRVKSNFTVGNYKAKIWIDEAFLKTNENKTGRLYIGRYKTSAVDTNVVSAGQTIDLTNAVINITVVDPNSPAVFTELKAAISTPLAHPANYYTPTSYQKYADAIVVGQEVVTHEGQYTVKEQPIIDAATAAIKKAYAELELLPATTTRLEEALKLTPEHAVESYTDDSYKTFDNAKKQGQSILAESNLTIADDFRINAAADAIVEAHKNLTLQPFRYTIQMEAALNATPEHPGEFYTDDTYGPYEAAYNALLEFKQSNPTCLDDARGMDLIFAVNQTRNALALKGVDFTPLEEAIGTELEYDSSLYTDETYADYQSAINAGNAILEETGLTVVDNERIIAAANNIYDAIDALDFKDFSYYALAEEALGTWFYEGADDDYTIESVDNFWNAYIELEEFLYSRDPEDFDIRDDEEAFRLINNLEYALNNMQFQPADLTLLEEALALETLDKEYYDPDTYAAYEAALAELYAYGEDYFWVPSEQDIVDGIAQAIIDAHGELVLKPFTKLADLEAAIAVTPEYDETYYIPEVYAEYTDALVVIEDMIANADNLTILDDPAADEAIVNYNAALEVLKSAFVDADYSDVEAAIGEANELDKDIYTNFEIVEEAIKSVVYGLNILKQETVNGYAAAIRQAINDLDIKAADYTAVDNAITAAEQKLSEMQATGIELKQSTVDAFNEAVEAVVDGLDITKQEEVQGYADAIIAATEALDYVSTIVLKVDSEAYITENGYIRGLSIIGTETEIAEQFDKYGKNTSIVVTPTLNGYGTGTLVQHFDGDELIKEYVIVIDADVNGDGIADANDLPIIIEHINCFTEPNEAYVKAAMDLFDDGWLDAIDLTIAICIVNMEEV